MRLVVLSEIYELWRRTVRSLERSARRYRGTQGPSPNEAYIFYQVLAALWGSESIDQLEERLVSYMCKAAREAKVKTSWVNPNQEYEANLETFVRSMMHDRWVARAIGPVTRYLSFYGLNNSISQLLLKVTSPGIPDFYQGTELWDLSLVDPDNRRPVDYRLRQILLNEMEPLLDRPDITIFRQWLHAIDARLKLYITVRMLRFRKAHAAIFQGSYQPLEVQRSMAGHFFAYARQANDGVTAITVIPLFTSILQDLDEKKDALIVLPAAGQWQEILSGQQIIAGGHTISAEDLPLPWAVLFKPTD
jgi:(1->4)-alpha-D-glucan 1-alpha-D-glucosylmutase